MPKAPSRNERPALEPDPEPTETLPFTAERLAVLRERIRRRQPLHQPGDAPLPERAGLVFSRRRGLRRLQSVAQDLDRNGEADRTLVSLDEILPLLPCRRRTLLNLIPHLPSPRACEDFPSGRGLNCRWWWCELRPWLERRFALALPARFPLGPPARPGRRR